MNILFLTLSTNMEDINHRGIYNDLVREFASRGINIYVVSPREKRTNLQTEIYREENINILKVRVGNVTKTKSFIEKGISTLLLESQYLKAIKKYYNNIHFDMVIYSTPPITFGRIVRYFKTKHKSKSYLILKDIFPQNAVDIGSIKKGSFIWNFFRRKEKRLYEISDFIGCMSQGNVEYILEHNPYLDKKKVEIFPNSILPVERITRNKNKELLDEYNIPKESTLFIYGGNLGKPQGIDFLLQVTDNFCKIDNGYLIIVGNGTEFDKIKNHLENKKYTNVKLFNRLPKNEYDQLLEIADVGLIFLDRRFTIPNFPSRLTAYMEYSIPVLAATDINTDLKDVLKESGSGFWSESGDLKTFLENANRLTSDSNIREQMGLNGRVYLEENYDIRKTVEVIIKHL